ncbi:hypothetical protein HanPI659440_Chr09g0339401 [Helianthus annuus]|nr:hypothetical protein HanPI659440_Chr09g0339401 [Helianthus annuus]
MGLVQWRTQEFFPGGYWTPSYIKKLVCVILFSLKSLSLGSWVNKIRV